MSRFRMYPTTAQAEQMLLHCAHARYVWNLAVEQHAHRQPGRRAAPGFAEQCRQLTEARRDNAWLRAGNADVQQQALKDFARAKAARFTSGFGEPTWRRKHVHEGFRVIGTDRVPESGPDGTPRLNATGRQVMGRSVVVQRLNRRWARVKVPGCGWVRFRLTRAGLPVAKTFRVTFRNGRWHIAFAVVPDPIDVPGTDRIVGIDRGVKITAALSDGRRLNCPQLTTRERARVRKHQRRAARAPKGSDRKREEYAKVARIKAREADRRKDWCEKTSTLLARTYRLIRFEKLNITTMTRSAKGTVAQPGTRVRQKAGLNRAILAQGWGLLRRRTGEKAPGRVEDVPAPYTSLRCSACGWIERDSRKSQAEFVCVSCGFGCNADENAAINVAAGQGGIPRPRRTAGAGGVTAAAGRSSAREPRPTRVGIHLLQEVEDVKYTVFGNGEIKVGNTLRPGAPGLPYLPEVGTLLFLPRRLDRLHYYGRGPEENQWDRNHGTDVGRYTGTVSGQWSGYLRPQENGNRTDVRWIALTDGSGRGLLACGEPLLEVNASHFTPEDLSAGARHDYQLTPRDAVVLRLSHRQMGVGGDDSWGAHTHDEFKLLADRDYAYTYRLRPLTDVDEATALWRRPTAGESTE